MLKTYAAYYYVDSLGVTTAQFALILLIYTFIDAIDNPIYGFLPTGLARGGAVGGLG
jgi:GPH family glycoside/pentoside/hexuronide:cation symporter